jgi:hypothetical protein
MPLRRSQAIPSLRAISLQVLPHASQKNNQIGRKRLAACKLRIELGGLPDIRGPLPARAKWKHKKRYQRLRNQVRALETQVNRHVFRKQIAVRTFAYHIV